MKYSLHWKTYEWERRIMELQCSEYKPQEGIE